MAETVRTIEGYSNVIMTEKEADQKRCTPSLIVQLMDLERLNALQAAGHPSGSTSCIGSRCAQWCWYDYANKEGVTFFPKNEALERANYHKGKSSPGKEVETEPRPARGYCGLTGSKE